MRDGVNVVAYVNANPVNLSDPYGTTGIGETISNIMSFINNNRGLVAGLIMDLMGPLEGVLDLMSAATGKDITGWLHGGMNGSPESMGWWDRACAAAGAAVKIAAGGLRLLSKLKGVLRKIEEIVKRAAAAAAGTGRKLCKLTGACFVAGTLVAMADGSFVPIEQVQPGQEVLCEQPSAVPGVAGEEMARQVTAAGGRVYEGAIITLTVECDGEVARVSGTPEHPFWCVSRREWMPIGQLSIGDTLDGLQGPMVIVGREVAFCRVPVFNLTVEGAHTYRITSLGLLVHNGNPCKVRATKGAGAHTGLKRDPQTGTITGYTEFDGAGRPVKRFRRDGGPHGGVKPPLIIEAKPGKGPGASLNRARPARSGEIPGG